MLLKRKITQASEEAGVALIAVIAVMAAGLIVATVIASVTVGAFGFSSSNRASVQSQAAADAGVAATRAGLYISGDCGSKGGVYSSSTAPVYTATVYYGTGGAWTLGCPVSQATATLVRVLSTGSAQAKAVNGASSNNSTTVEAIFKYIWPGVTPSGPDLYLEAGGVFEANSSFDVSEGTTAGLMVKNGNLVCAKNNAVINGNIVINGVLDFSGNKSCTVNGNTWVSGAALLGSKGKISGNLSAASVSPNPPGSQVGGTYTQGGALPTVPGWVDFPYNPAVWVDSTGTPYTINTLSGSGCAWSGSTNQGGATGLPMIINGLGCSGGIALSNNTTVNITSDVAIFGNQFNWGALNAITFKSSSSTVHRVWFITPDTIANGKPDCQTSLAAPNTQGDFAIKNGFAISSTIDAMLYTPCAFAGKNGFTWNGQIYAGSYSYLQNNPSFTAVQIGLPGYDLSQGSSTPVLLAPRPDIPITNRNYTG